MLAILIIVLMISLCEAAGQTLTYYAYMKSSTIILATSLVFYIAVVYLLYRSYRYKGVGYVNILWSGMTTILMITIGYFAFNERLSMMEWIGAGFILTGILLMSIHHAAQK